MSNSNFGSSYTSTGYGDPIFSSYSSSQDTQATDLSYTYPDPSLQQISNNTGGQTILFKNIGYGAPDASGRILPYPIAPIPTVYGPTEYGPTVPGPIVSGPPTALRSQSYAYSTCSTEPWSTLTSSKGCATTPTPSLNIWGTPTQGPGELVYQSNGYAAFQSASGVSPAASSNGWSTGQCQDIGFQPQPPNLAVTQQHRSSPGQSVRLPPPKVARKKSNTGFPCPECDEPPFSRRDSVDRHRLTKHTEGPFWLCDICDDYWWSLRREDKMQAHCRKKHPSEIMIDVNTREETFPYHKTMTVGDQECEPRATTNGKRTRRPKKKRQAVCGS